MNSPSRQSPHPIRHVGRWSYRIFWYVVVSVIITAAIVISLVRVYLPDVKAYREQIEQVASKFLEHEVRIASMDARLLGMTPVLIFDDVHMMDKTRQRELVQFDSARLSVDLLASLRQGRIVPKGFTIKGADLAVTRRENGTLLIQGIDLESWTQSFNRGASEPGHSSNELAQWLFRRSRLGLEDSAIVWQDFAREGKVMQFRNVNFKLRNQGERHQLTGALTVPEEMGRDVQIAMDLYGNVLDPRQWQGKFYVQGFEIDVANWGIKPAFERILVHEGKADFRIWGEWDKGAPRSISGEVETYDVKLSSRVRKNPLSLAQVGGRFSWQGDADQWRLNISGFNFARDEGGWPSTRISVVQTTKGDGRQWRLYSDYIRIEDVNTLLAESGLLEPQLQQTLKTLALQGNLSRANVLFETENGQAPRFVVDSKFSNLENRAWKRVPAMRGLRGRIHGSDRRGMIALDTSQAEFDFGNLFRQPLALKTVQGQWHWWRDAGQLVVSSESMKLATEDIQTTTAATLTLPLAGNTSPYIDLQSRFWDGEARRAGRYYPVGIMDDELVQWLDEGVVSGRVERGGAMLRGRLKDFPFRNHEGKFAVAFDASDVVLNYKPGWEPLRDIKARARFTGRGLQIRAQHARVFDSHMDDLSVGIARYKRPVLSIDGGFRGAADDFARFFASSPVGEPFREAYQQVKIGGGVKASMHVDIPLSDRVKRDLPLRYRGQLNLQDGELHLLDGAVDITKVGGTIGVEDGELSSQDLRARIFGGPAQLKLFMNPIEGDRKVPQVAIEGEMAMDRLARIFAIPAFEKIKGRANWQGLVSAGLDRDGAYVPGFIQYRSDLKGVELGLPPPLAKPAQLAKPFFMKMQFSRFNRPTLFSQLGDELKLRLMFNTDDPLKTRLVKGAVAFSQAEVTLPANEQLRLSGSIQALALGRWQRLIDKLEEVESDKPTLADTNIPVVFDFDEVHIVTDEDTKTPDLDAPHDSSLLNGEIKALHIADMALGHFTIVSKRINDGIEYETITLDTGRAKIKGSGTWTYRNGQNQTNVVLQLTTDNVGRMLRDLGLKAIIEDGKGNIVLQAVWPASPADFAFERLDGSLSVAIEEGKLVEVDPGAGRLFGLLSLSELPRRLMLDFSELDKGFKFDLIRGNFNIEDGNANTDNLFLDGPIALIRIQGETGLARRDFDQYVTVIPRVSGTLPVVSGLAWGSQIGALVFLFERLMGSEVDESVARRYHISGSWEQPRIRRVGNKDKQ